MYFYIKPYYTNIGVYIYLVLLKVMQVLSVYIFFSFFITHNNFIK